MSEQRAPRDGTAELPRVGIFIKSFAPDFPQLVQLIESIERFAEGTKMPIVISVPAGDLPALRDRIGLGRVTMVCDEAYAGGREGLTGWEHQQVCKLSAWRLGIAETLVSIDSDSYFIRPIRPDVFLGPDGGAKLVMSRLRGVFRHDNAPLVARLLEGRVTPVVERPRRVAADAARVDLRPHLATALRERWAHTHTKRARLSAIFPREGGHFHAMPGALLQAWLLEDLDRRLLAPQGLSARDLILICPWEYDWQLEWALATGFPFEPVDPLLFHVDSEAGYREAVDLGIDEGMIARHFLGIAMASRHLARTRF